VKKDITDLEKLWYYFANICLWGIPWLIKVIVKKAMIEVKDDSTN